MRAIVAGVLVAAMTAQADDLDGWQFRVVAIQPAPEQTGSSVPKQKRRLPQTLAFTW